MPDVIEDLEPQEDASASSEPEVRFADDKSVDTAVESKPEPVEVETKAEEVEDEPESEVDSSTTDEENVDETIDPETEVAADSANVKDRIDKLTERFRQQERDNEGLRQENAELRQQAARPQVREPFKTLADFDYDEAKYQSYMATEIDTRAEAAGARAAEGVHAKAEVESREESFRRGEKDFAKGHPDYFDLVYGEVDGLRNWVCSDVMLQEIMLSDMGQPLTYYLASNPDVAKDMSKLNPRDTAIRMDRLQTELKAEKAKVKADKKVVSKAPPPTPKIEKGKEPLEKDPADMSDREFAKMRRKQIANR